MIYSMGETVFFVVQQTVEAWRTVFYLGAAVYVLGTIIYGIFGSGEIQPWAKPKETEELEGLDAANKEAAAKEREAMKDKEQKV